MRPPARPRRGSPDNSGAFRSIPDNSGFFLLFPVFSGRLSRVMFWRRCAAGSKLPDAKAPHGEGIKHPAADTKRQANEIRTSSRRAGSMRTTRTDAHTRAQTRHKGRRRSQRHNYEAKGQEAATEAHRRPQRGRRSRADKYAGTIPGEEDAISQRQGGGMTSDPVEEAPHSPRRGTQDADVITAGNCAAGDLRGSQAATQQRHNRDTTGQRLTQAKLRRNGGPIRSRADPFRHKHSAGSGRAAPLMAGDLPRPSTIAPARTPREAGGDRIPIKGAPARREAAGGPTEAQGRAEEDNRPRQGRTAAERPGEDARAPAAAHRQRPEDPEKPVKRDRPAGRKEKPIFSYFAQEEKYL